MEPYALLCLTGVMGLVALPLLLLALVSRPPRNFTWMAMLVTWLSVMLTVVVVFILIY